MKTSLRSLLGITLVLSLLGAGCYQSKNYVAEKTTDFSQFHTVMVKEAIAANGLDPYRSGASLYKSMTKDAVAMNLEGKGFQAVDTNSDLVITPIWWVSSDNTLDDWSSSGARVSATPAATIESKLEITVTDGQTGKKLWRGWSMYPVMGRDLTESAIKKSVSEALKHFPPPTKK